MVWRGPLSIQLAADTRCLAKVASSTVVFRDMLDLRAGTLSHDVHQGNARVVCSLSSCASASHCQGSTITGLEAAWGAPDTTEQCSCMDVSVAIQTSHSSGMQTFKNHLCLTWLRPSALRAMLEQSFFRI